MAGRIARRLLALLVTGLVSCASIPGGEETYQNPVLDSNFPDPAVLHAPDGWFYAYATNGAARGTTANIQVARSRNLVNWEHLGDALPRKPDWGAHKQMFWAPHVIFDRPQQRYFMYYSAEPDGADGKCLAVATSQNPAGPFVDAGKPMLCGEGIEHIDPMAFDDPGTGMRLLYWGSGSKPIRVQELAPDRMSFLPGSEPRPLVFPDKDRDYEGLIEGAWVVFRDGTYYLFYSGGLCCGPRARYAVLVARSASPLGPFERRDSPILRNNGFWLAPGHNSVVRDAQGTDWILYHAVDAARAHFENQPLGSPRVMLLDRIEYVDDWPRIAGDQPSTSRQRAPAP